MKKPIDGVVIGIVKSLEDPEGMGRIKLDYPALAEESFESQWARIVTPFAGSERGLQIMPEIGDEALVVFEHGDLRFPYVLGFLWNRERLPPRSEPQQRTLETVSGHVLEFDDTEGSEKISLLFKGDLPSITLEEGAIKIQTSDQSFIELTDTAITIKNTTLVDINP